MAEFLFITPQELIQGTIIGGNVDVDKYITSVANVQISTIEPLIGSELYDKIKMDAQANTLNGLYLTLYNEFIKPITKAEATAEYIEISSYILDNGGLYKHQSDNAEIVDKNEAQYLAGKYHSMAQMYIQRFEKWICKNTIEEYKTNQDEVNALKGINEVAGWKL